MYNSKLIAHSLGNFIFDLNYPETYPSMILNVNFNQNGLVHSTILPLYIDDYLTKPANGELGNYILDYMAMKSKELVHMCMLIQIIKLQRSLWIQVI